jgi:hypothetical protein
MTRRTLILLLAAIMGVAAPCIGGRAAYGYFTSAGSGTGSGGTGTLQAVTVTAFVGGDSPSSVLVPGASADVILRVNNPNASAVTLVSVTGGPGSITADSAHPGCTTTGVSFTNQTGMSVPIASGTILVHLPNAASMNASSSSGCQGATFNIPVSITVHE